MATVTLLGTPTLNTTSGTHTVTATPAVGDLIVLVVANTGYTGTTAPTDNNSSGTYTLAGGLNAVKATSADRLQVYVRDALIPAATSTVFTHAPGTTSGGGLAVFAVTGMQRVGSAAIRSSGKQDNQAASTTPAPVLSSAPLAANPVLTAVFNATSPGAVTAPGSFTRDVSLGYSTPTTGLSVARRDSGQTSATITWGSTSTAFASIAVELDTSEPVSLLVELLQTSTVIASWTEDLTTTFTTVERTLSGAEADAITDYTALRLRFTATGVNGKRARVSWAEVQVPTAPPGGTSTPVALSGTQAQAGTLTVQPKHLLSGTQAQSGSLARQVRHTLSGTQAQAGTLTRQTAHSLSGTQAQSGSLTHQARHTLSGTQAQAGTVTARQAIGISLSGTQAQAGSLTRRVGHTLTGTQAQAGTLIRAVTHRLSGSQAQTGSVTRTVVHRLAGTQAQSGSVVAIKAKLVVVAGTQAQSGSLTRTALHPLGGTQPQAGSVIRLVPRSLVGTQPQVGGVSTVIGGGGHSQALTGTQAQVGGITPRGPQKLTGTQAQTGNLTVILAHYAPSSLPRITRLGGSETTTSCGGSRLTTRAG